MYFQLDDYPDIGTVHINPIQNIQLLPSNYVCSNPYVQTSNPFDIRQSKDIILDYSDESVSDGDCSSNCSCMNTHTQRQKKKDQSNSNKRVPEQKYSSRPHFAKPRNLNIQSQDVEDQFKQNQQSQQKINSIIKSTLRLHSQKKLQLQQEKTLKDLEKQERKAKLQEFNLTLKQQHKTLKQQKVEPKTEWNQIKPSKKEMKSQDLTQRQLSPRYKIAPDYSIKQRNVSNYENCLKNSQEFLPKDEEKKNKDQEKRLLVKKIFNATKDQIQKSKKKISDIQEKEVKKYDKPQVRKDSEMMNDFKKITNDRLNNYIKQQKEQKESDQQKKIRAINKKQSLLQKAKEQVLNVIFIIQCKKDNFNPPNYGFIFHETEFHKIQKEKILNSNKDEKLLDNQILQQRLNDIVNLNSDNEFNEPTYFQQTIQYRTFDQLADIHVGDHHQINAHIVQRPQQQNKKIVPSKQKMVKKKQITQKSKPKTQFSNIVQNMNPYDILEIEEVNHSQRERDIKKMIRKGYKQENERKKTSSIENKNKRPQSSQPFQKKFFEMDDIFNLPARDMFNVPHIHL